jgi:hypothetical protein
MRQASLKQKRLEHITTELGKIGVITSQISDICMTIHTVVIPELDALNERIPDAHRLPPVVQFLPASLSLDVGTKNSSNSNDHMILPAHELVVIDKS